MERTYKKIEIAGASEKSFEMRGLVENGKVKEFQVTVKIGFRLEEEEHA